MITYPTPTPRFTAPEECFTQIWTLPPLGPDMITTLSTSSDTGIRTSDDTSLAYGLVKGFTASCYPSGFTAQPMSIIGDPSNTTVFPTFSPATCPLGYDVAASHIVSGKTEATCYPSIFAFPGTAADLFLSSVAASLCTFKWADPSDSTRIPLWISSGYMFTTYVQAWYNTPVIVQYAASDQAYWNNTRTTTVASTLKTLASPAHSSSPSTSTSKHQLSHRVKIGIGIGVALGAILCLALLFFSACWWLRKRRRDRLVELAGDGLPCQDDKKALDAGNATNNDGISELPSPDVPGRGRGAELGGSWHGSEAPALIEVDLSRPIRPTDEAASVEKPDETISSTAARQSKT